MDTNKNYEKELNDFFDELARKAQDSTEKLSEFKIDSKAEDLSETMKQAEKMEKFLIQEINKLREDTQKKLAELRSNAPENNGSDEFQQWKDAKNRLETLSDEVTSHLEAAEDKRLH